MKSSWHFLLFSSLIVPAFFPSENGQFSQKYKLWLYLGEIIVNPGYRPNHVLDRFLSKLYGDFNETDFKFRLLPDSIL